MGLGSLSPTAAATIGYTGGGFLAICLWPQIHKIIKTRSAEDISYAYSILYVSGLALSLVYLLYENAMAAWIPVAIEILGAFIVMKLKFLCDKTSFGNPGREKRAAECVELAADGMVPVGATTRAQQPQQQRR